MLSPVVIKGTKLQINKINAKNAGTNTAIFFFIISPMEIFGIKMLFYTKGRKNAGKNPAFLLSVVIKQPLIAVLSKFFGIIKHQNIGYVFFIGHNCPN